MLVEGSSMRSISRVADVSIDTVAKLLAEAGEACIAHHDRAVRNVTTKRIHSMKSGVSCKPRKRRGMRRFTRLTNAFSKKLESHEHAIALYFTHYNFVRMHKTLKWSPAMAAGPSKTLWSMEDIVAMIDARNATLKTRGPYKPRAPKKVISN